MNELMKKRRKEGEELKEKTRQRSGDNEGKTEK